MSTSTRARTEDRIRSYFARHATRRTSHPPCSCPKCIARWAFVKLLSLHEQPDYFQHRRTLPSADPRASA